MIAAKIDTSLLSRKLSAVQLEQLPFAVSLAINKTAAKVKQKEELNLKFALDRPTPFTLQSVLLTRPANKRGPFERDVFLRDEATKGTPPVKYLEPLVRGGERRVKRFERALRARGIMGPREYAVPGRGARLDGYGNIRAGQIVQILSQLRAFSESGFLANETLRSRAKAGQGRDRFFATRAGQRLKPGVYKRTGPTTSSRQRAIARSATRQVRDAGFNVRVIANKILPREVSPVLVFVKAPRYRRTLKFTDVAEQTWRREFGGEFRRAMREALRTARR